MFRPTITRLLHLRHRVLFPAACLALVLTPGAAARAAQGGFTTIDNPGGGRIITGTLPATDSTTAAALTDMLRRTHRYFGERPNVGRLIVTPDGATALAFFSERTQSGPVWGVVLAAAEPGRPPRGALVFDLASRISNTLGPMLSRLAAITPSGAAGVPLTRETFPDNSGSIGVPAGWTLKSAGRGAFDVTGPNGEFVLSGLELSAFVPGSFMDRTMRRLRAAGYPRTGVYAVVPFSPDPLRAAVAIGSSLQEQSGKPPLRILRVIADRVLGHYANSTIGYIEGIEDVGDGRGPVHFVGEVMFTPPGMPGGWFLSYLLAVQVPERENAAMMPTVLAIIRSLRLNQQVLSAERQAQQRWFDTFEGIMQRREDAMSASNAAFDRTIRGVSVFADNSTGRHYEAPSGLASAIVQGAPTRFHYVPLTQYIKGVDY